MINMFWVSQGSRLVAKFNIEVFSDTVYLINV